jgi:hypothetical protein
MNQWDNDPVLYRDYQYDNILYRSPNPAPAPGGGVVDVVARIANAGNSLRTLAQTFVLADIHGNRAFPLANTIPAPLNVNLSTTPCAWMLYRYGVSDHLPVLVTVTI